MTMGDISDSADRECGLGNFRPRCLQIFARIGAFVGIYSLSGILTSTLSVYVNSQVPTLEKQFGFSSAETGFLMACNDIGYLAVVIFSGYLAKRVHIPRGLGVTTILFGVCGILCALPHFLQDRSTYALESSSVNTSSNTLQMRNKVPMCKLLNVNGSLHTTGSSEDTCTFSSKEGEYALEQLSTKKMAYILIAIGMIFQGIGKAPRYPFLTLYIDDSVSKKKTGFYFGILISTGIFGPVLAYLAGGAFSKLYVTLESVPITPTDPRWIGAWWLGFLVFGACAIVCSIPLMCFPRNIMSTRRLKELQATNDDTKPTTTEQKTGKTPFLNALIAEVKEYLLSYVRIFKNPAFNLLNTSTVINILGVAGSGSFMPKYFTLQYNIPLWKSNILVACFSILSVSIGTFVGGVISRRVKMTPFTTCKMVILFYTIQLISIAAGFFLGCDQPVLHGGNSLRAPTPFYELTDTPCNVDCICDESRYFPICGDDGRSYFSPCHAGCTSKDFTSFSNCTCIESGHATAGLCDQGCTTKLYAYSVLTFIGKLFTAFNIVPTFIAKVRSVEERDRAVGTATQGFLISALAWIPGPVIFGAIIDNTCSLWKYTCGERQSCTIYDIEFFRVVLHAYMLICLAVATLLIGCVYIYFKVTGVNKWLGDVEPDLKNMKDKDTDVEMKTTLKE